MSWELIVVLTLSAVLVALLVLFRRRESRYLERPTRDALSASLKEEIESEREAALKRREQFEEILKKVNEPHHTHN